MKTHGNCCSREDKKTGFWRKTPVKVMALLFVVLLLTTSAACKKPPKQSGYVPQEYTAVDLSLKGTITFTETNISTPEDELAPRAIVRAFMAEYPEITVKYEQAARATFATRISSGDIGDVFWGDEADMYNYAETHNAIMPLDAYIKPLNIDLGDVYSGALDTGMIGGKLYMAPRNIGEHLLIYNKDMLIAEGIDYDGSEALPWEEFKSICQQMTKFADDNTLIQCGCSMKLWWNPVWQVFLRGYGGSWVDTINKKITIVDSNEVMQGVNEMFNAVFEGWMYPEDLSGRITGELRTMFSNIPDGNSNLADVCFKSFGDLSWMASFGKAYDSFGIDWDFCSMPAFPTQNISAGATGYMVYNRTTNPDSAAAFALFFLTPSGQTAYHSQVGGNVPLLRSLAEDDFWRGKGSDWTDKNFSAFVAYPDLTKPASVEVQLPPEIAEFFSPDNLQEMFANIFSGKIDVQTAFSQLQTKANERWSTIIS